MRGPIMRFFLNEDINFLVTNRLPRRFATQLVGRLARIEHPLIARPSLALWKFFAGVDLSDARTTGSNRCATASSAPCATVRVSSTATPIPSPPPATRWSARMVGSRATGSIR